MKRLLNKRFLFALIIVLAAFLRFFKLGSYPALNADEAAIGYNAYSLLETGLDEHGNPWPIHFQSFNDYKPGFFFYLVLPFVKVLGLNIFAVRIPGALMGVLSVYLIYALVKELFDRENFALVSSFFLAISPWHIHFSRGAWEVNTATFLIIAGLLFFFKALKKPRFLVVSFLFFVLSLYTYHAARVIVPLLGLGLIIIYRNTLLRNKKKVLTAAVISILLLLPLAKDLYNSPALSRAAGVGLFADPGPINRINEQRGDHEDLTSLIARGMHNKAVNYGLAFLENWGEHFHGEFLFMSGDQIQRNKVPETGVMYISDMLFILVGIYFIFSKGKFNNSWKSVFWWLAISPVAAALTFQSPHALRAQNMVIPLTIIGAYGFVNLWSLLQKRKLLIINYLLVAIVGWGFMRYSHMYWVHMAKEYPFSSQYGVKELVDYVGKNAQENEKVVVSNRYDQPYILFLFYMNYPPKNFQGLHELTPRDQFGFSTVTEFGKYVFTSIDNWGEIKNKYPGALIAGTDEDVPDGENIIKEINGSNGVKYFEVIKNSP